MLALILTMFVVLCCLAISTCVAAASFSSPSSAGNALPANFGDGFPITLRPCDGSLTQSWQFVAGDTAVAMASSNTVVWETYGGVQPNNHVTLWNAGDVADWQKASNFLYRWAVKKQLSGGTHTLGQLHQGDLCVGYARAQDSELLTLMNCSLKNATDLRLTPSPANGGNTFTLATPDARFCVAVPVPYENYRELGGGPDDDFRLGIGINGFSPRNVSFVAKFNVKLRAYPGAPWSPNLMLWPSAAGDGSFSMSSISVKDPSTGQERFYMPTGGQLTSAPSTTAQRDEIAIDGIKLRAAGNSGNDDDDVAATEKWTLRKWKESNSSASSFSWRIARTYTKDIRGQEASRFATFLWAPVSASPHIKPWQQTAMMSSIDPTFQRNVSNAGAFRFFTGQGDSDAIQGYLYAYSQRTNGTFYLSPQDVCFRWRIIEHTRLPSSSSKNSGNVSFTMQWPSTAPTGMGGIGLLLPSPPGAGARDVIRSGSEIDVEFVLTVAEDPAECTVAPLSVAAENSVFPSPPEFNRTAALVNLSRTFTLWAGSQYGNSPESSQCIFELGLLQTCNSILSPDSKEAADEIIATQRAHLEFLLDAGIVTDSGYVKNQLCQFSWCQYPAMYQSQTQFLLAIGQFCIMSGDRQFLLRHWNSSVVRALNFLLDDAGMQMRKTDGIALCTGYSDLASGIKIEEGTRARRNAQSADWRDTVNAGGADSIIVVEAIQVVKMYSDVARWINDTALASELDALHATAVATFNRVFWCQDEVGFFADWIPITSFPLPKPSADGTAPPAADMRCGYNYLWQQALALDPLSGVLEHNSTRARIILDAIDAGYDRILAAYGRSYNLGSAADGGLWGTPTNFRFLRHEDEIVPWRQGSEYIGPNGQPDPNVPSGNYLGGAIFSLMIGHEISMRFHHSSNVSTPFASPRSPMHLLDRTLARFADARLWGQHFGWASTDNASIGWKDNDVLTDTAYVAVGFTSLFKIRRTLTEGIILRDASSPPGPAFANFSWTFMHLGERTRATVTANGTVELTSVPWQQAVAQGSNSNTAGIVVGIIFAILALLSLALVIWSKYDINKRNETHDSGEEKRKLVLQRQRST